MSEAGLTVCAVGHGDVLPDVKHEEKEMTIECGRCEARGPACGSCAAMVIAAAGPAPLPAGEPELGPAELRALAVLASAGMIPPLRYAPRMAKAS